MRRPPNCPECFQPMEVKAKSLGGKGKKKASGKTRMYHVTRYGCDLCGTVETIYGNNERSEQIAKTGTP